MVQRDCPSFSIVPNLLTIVRKRCRSGPSTQSNQTALFHPARRTSLLQKAIRISQIRVSERQSGVYLSQIPAETNSRFSTSQARKSVEEERSGFWSGAIVELLAGTVGIALCKLCNLPILGPKFSFTLPALIQACQMVVPFSLVFWLTEIIPTAVSKSSDARFRIIFESRSLFHIAFFCACVSVGEEILFRSWVLASLCAVGMAPPLALALSALIFGLLHAYTRVYMVLATIAGLLFGSMFLSSGSVLQPIVVHFLYDFLTVMFMKFRWQSRSPIR